MSMVVRYLSFCKVCSDMQTLLGDSLSTDQLVVANKGPCPGIGIRQYVIEQLEGLLVPAPRFVTGGEQASDPPAVQVVSLFSEIEKMRSAMGAFSLCLFGIQIIVKTDLACAVTAASCVACGRK